MTAQLDARRRDQLYYQRHRARVGGRLKRALLRAAATIDAVQLVNDRSEELGLLDLTLSVEEVHATAVMVLRAEVAAILAKSGYLPRDAKYQIVERVVARLVPLRDFVDPTTGRVDRRALERTASLEGMLRREMKNMEKPDGR